jgi:hypothetical protein
MVPWHHRYGYGFHRVIKIENRTRDHENRSLKTVGKPETVRNASKKWVWHGGVGVLTESTRFPIPKGAVMANTFQACREIPPAGRHDAHAITCVTGKRVSREKIWE